MALSDQEFWGFIRSLNGTIDQSSAAVLATRLSVETPAKIIAFAEKLAELLYAIDSLERAEQHVSDQTVGEDSFTMSDDLFLYARCAVVAAGTETYQRVLNDPAAMEGHWAVFDGECLLTVVPEAWEEVTGQEWDHETRVCYETGSNSDRWPVRE